MAADKEIKRSSREIILDILIEVMEKGKFSHIELRNMLDKHAYLEKNERNFITRLSEGTIERTIELDYIIDLYSKTAVKKMKPMIRNLLRMSVYQIKYMDSVPDSAVCNEAVKIASKRGFSNLKGFVNGVLRNISRADGNFKYPDKEENYLFYLSVKYSMPEWIVKKWIKEYGEETAAALLEGSSAADEGKTSVRLNVSKASKEEIIKSLQSENIQYEESEYFENALYIKEYDKLELIEAFKKGYIQPQDISSMFVGMIADPKAGDVVMDICAAPGGKTIHLADILKYKEKDENKISGKVLSSDVSESKVRLIAENVARSDFDNIEARVADATKKDDELVGTADVLVADVPCSGLGVLNKKTDIKYKLEQINIKELADLQKKIIENVYDYIKPGGVLIYSTCTVNKTENDKNAAWIEKNFDLEPESLDDYIPEELRSETTQKGYLQLFQGIQRTDGFFIARFRKKDKQDDR